MTESRPPSPPFTAETAAQMAHAAEDAWNSRDSGRVRNVFACDESEVMLGEDDRHLDFRVSVLRQSEMDGGWDARLVDATQALKLRECHTQRERHSPAQRLARQRALCNAR